MSFAIPFDLRYFIERLVAGAGLGVHPVKGLVCAVGRAEHVTSQVTVVRDGKRLTTGAFLVVLQIGPKIFRVHAIQGRECHGLASDFRSVRVDDITVTSACPLVTGEGGKATRVVVPFRVIDDLLPDRTPKRHVDTVIGPAQTLASACVGFDSDHCCAIEVVQ